LLYAHGGLNPPKAQPGVLLSCRTPSKKTVFILIILCTTRVLLEELKDAIFRRKKKTEDRADGIGNWTDRLLEWATRVPGRALWRKMKTGMLKMPLIEVVKRIVHFSCSSP